MSASSISSIWVSPSVPMVWPQRQERRWWGRSVKNLVDLVGDLHKQGVQFMSLTDAIDTGTPSGWFFFHVMASLAKMERELTVERTCVGLEIAGNRDVVADASSR